MLFDERERSELAEPIRIRMWAVEQAVAMMPYMNSGVIDSASKLTDFVVDGKKPE